MWHVRGQPVSTQHVEGRVEVWGGEGARAELGCVAAVWGGEACFREYPGGWRGLWKGFGERRACSARASGYCAPCSAAVLPIRGGAQVLPRPHRSHQAGTDLHLIYHRISQQSPQRSTSRVLTSLP